MPAPAFVFSPAYETDIGAHVFRTDKYRRVRELLLESRAAGPEAFGEPADEGRDVLALVHHRFYLEDLFRLRVTPATAASELPLDAAIVRWFETAVHGTIGATRAALDRGAAFHIGGGFHHAFAGHAEGFCYLNDVAVAAAWALTTERILSVSVVDLYVHQGNGTAHIFREEGRVFTFSMHQENNYPVKETSDLDMGLPDGIEDAAYLARLDRGLDVAVRERRPGIVYYVAGADPYREDRLGGLALSMDGLRERDRRVFAACREVGATTVVTLAGGYAMNPEDTARIHRNTALEFLAAWPWRAAPRGAGATGA